MNGTYCVPTVCPPFRFLFSSRAATRQHVVFCCSLKYHFSPSMHRLRLLSLGTIISNYDVASLSTQTTEHLLPFYSISSLAAWTLLFMGFSRQRYEHFSHKCFSIKEFCHRCNVNSNDYIIYT